MATPIRTRLQAVLAELDAGTQSEVLDFAEFLAHKKAKHSAEGERLSEEEHARILTALDAVSALSQENGPPVSNRDHDAHLYGDC